MKQFFRCAALILGAALAFGFVSCEGDVETEYLNKEVKVDKTYASVGINYPANYVNWYDAIVYCNLRSMAENLTPVYKLGGETDPTNWSGIVGDAGTKFCGSSSSDTAWDGITADFSADGYRLPTEAEWEYIAREGNNGIPATQTTYAGSDTIGDVVWYSGNSDRKTHEVKGKNANTLRIYDMSGNMAEWCWDWHGEENIDSSTSASGASSGNARVTRGGSWGSKDSICTVAYRSYSDPYSRTCYLGFRVVRTSSAN